jgi:uncharacterized protein
MSARPNRSPFSSDRDYTSTEKEVVAMNLPGISLAESDGQVYLRCQPVPERAPVDVAMVHALLHDNGFDGCRWFDEAIAQAAQDCNGQHTPFVAHIADRRDAEIVVDIDSDNMSAWVSIVAPEGGKPADSDSLLRSLADAGVTFGIDMTAVQQCCAMGAVEHQQLAIATLPVAGADTQFESLIPKAADRAPKVDDSGHIDYREHGGIFVVTAGAPLLRRTPPTAGIPGRTVRGQLLPAKPGLDVPFAAQLTGVETAHDDPNLLLAASAGQPVLVQHGAIVEPVLHLKDVNLTSGNIYFDGTVSVEGDVAQGMKIQASGDILVGGTVEGGLLEAGGDICIAGGVISQSQLRSKGAISARFAESCKLYAGTVIALEDMALQCELESLNQIVIGEKSPQRGKLVGGSATTMMLLNVPILGSENGGVTRVVVGANAELMQQLTTLNLRMEQEKEAEEKLQKLVKQLTAVGDPKGMLDRVKASWQQALQVWSKSLVEQVALEAKIAFMLTAKAKIGVGVAGPVDLSFGDKTVLVRKQLDSGQFAFDAQVGLFFEDPSGRSQALV